MCFLWCVEASVRLKIRPAAPAILDCNLEVGHNEGSWGCEDNQGQVFSAFIFDLNMVGV